MFDKAKGVNDPLKAFTVFQIPQDFVVVKDRPIKEYYLEYYPELSKWHKRLIELESLVATDEKYLHEQKDLFDKLDHADAWRLASTYENYLKFFEVPDIDGDVLTLSGGEQKKILLSVGLSSTANLVLWDEPTNHLDIETIERFEDELRQTNRAYILISHDRTLLSKVCKKIFHITSGEIKEYEGSYADYLEFLAEKEEERKRVLARLKNSLRRETDWMRQGIKARGTRAKSRVDNFKQLKGQVENIISQTRKDMSLNISSTDKKRKKLLEFKKVSFGFDGTNLFENIDLIMTKGEKIGLIGPNGVGKSSLASLISEKFKPTDGTIQKADDIIIKYFSQKRTELDLEKTPYEILGDGSEFIFMPDGRQKHVISYLEDFLFPREEINRPLRTFSGGERSRLQMALNLKEPGDIWIFDEPTNDLDLETLQILEKALMDFEGSIILISHDRSFLSNITNRVWLLDHKKIEFFQAGYEQVSPYLEALALSKEFEEEGQSEELSKAAGAPVIQKKKLSNKEKDRLKKLPKLIETTERKIEELNSKVLELGTKELSQEESKQLAHLASEMGTLEESLLSMYEEFELLQA
ncbi:MAG: ATP-binding cassette subfamily F protein uup [Bacteriovoracaceae bacterium]|jgi:ATP-binding cassette subfamily F protein uup